MQEYVAGDHSIEWRRKGSYSIAVGSSFTCAEATDVGYEQGGPSRQPSGNEYGIYVRATNIANVSCSPAFATPTSRDRPLSHHMPACRQATAMFPRRAVIFPAYLPLVSQHMAEEAAGSRISGTTNFSHKSSGREEHCAALLTMRT